MKLYAELADWWPLMSAPEEYAEEAAFYHQILLGAVSGEARTLLELGSGGGNNASHLTTHWQMTLVDLSAGMLEVSRALNPACEHIRGDMRDVRLGRTFDAVFIHDGICFMETMKDLDRALATAFDHTRPGGGLVVAPDDLADNFRDKTDCGGHDGAGRSLRWLEWSHDPDPNDGRYQVEYVYLCRGKDGTLSVERDSHTCGLFRRSEWLEALARAGFTDARAVPFDHSELEPGSYEIFTASRALSR